MSRVLIVDDHQRLRRSVRESLDRALAGGIFGEAGGSAEALDLARQEPWDLVLLDLSLPDGSGLETLRQLRSLRPATPVLVMSMHPESQYGAAARAAGAAGYLAKGGDPQALARAVRRALAGVAPAEEPGDEDRRPAGRILHDDLAQALAALKINLQLANSAADPAELRRRIGESLPLVDEAIESTRRLAARLRLAGLEEEPR
jgi:two-component system invasion response regulator UvrY